MSELNMSENEPKSGYDLPLLPFDQFHEAVQKMPQEKEVIDGALTEKQLGLISGDPFMGKSLEEQMLAFGFEAGAKWHGLSLAQSRTVYLTWEGSTKGIDERFSCLQKSFFPDCIPLLKMFPKPIHLNTENGFQEMGEFLQHAVDQYGVKIVLFDSFPYTIKGDYRKDTVVNPWYENLMQLVHKLGITPIVVFELRKFTMWGGSPEDFFSLERLKGGKTMSYKCYMAMMIGEAKKQVRKDGVITWVDDGHRIVIKKAKDSRGGFDPLNVKLNRDTLLFEGDSWAWNNDEKQYKAVSNGITDMV